jgi:hypothetical protein
MPFRKRKKEAEKQQRLETRLTNEQRIETAIAEAEKISEPGEKLMKVEEILGDIRGVINSEEQLIRRKGYAAGEHALAGGALSAVGMMVGGLATVIIAPPAAPVGLGMALTALPTLIAGLPATSLREKAVKKKFNAEAKDHQQTMMDFKQLAADMRKELVAYITDHKSEMLSSPFYEQVSKLPDLAKEFEGVAAQELAKYKQMEASAKEAPAKTVKLTDKPKKLLRRPPQA